MFMIRARNLPLLLCALTLAALGAPGAAHARQAAAPPPATPATIVAQPAVSTPLRLVVTGAALVVGVILGLIPAIVIGILLGLIPRPARGVQEERPARAPPTPARSPGRASGVVVHPPEAFAPGPAVLADVEPEPLPDFDVTESRERYRHLYDDAYSEQLREVDALRRTISIRLAASPDRPPQQESDR
jgi:hypothetical protein